MEIFWVIFLLGMFFIFASPFLFSTRLEKSSKDLEKSNQNLEKKEEKSRIGRRIAIIGICFCIFNTGNPILVLINLFLAIISIVKSSNDDDLIGVILAIFYCNLLIESINTSLLLDNLMKTFGS
jgi:hypothetical protein